MPIKAYVGLPRSGKTYEVTSVVIYNALKIGRRVVSNIAGLNQDEYYRLLELEGLSTDKLGSIVQIDHEQVLKPDFWLNENDYRQGKQTFLQAGDFLVLDEIWRFYDGFNSKDTNGNKLPDAAMNFFRMHGHFTHIDTGLCCEMAFITQDVMDCGRKLRAVIDETYRTTKLTAIGSTKRYRIDVFTRGKVTAKPIRQLYGTYDDKFFNLYKSHSQKKEGAADPREVSTDKRANILSGKFFVFVLPLMLLVGAFSWRTVSHFFSTHDKKELPISAQAVGQNPSTGSSQPASIEKPVSTWHIVGLYKLKNLPVLLLKNDNGSFRHVFKFDSLSISGLAIDAIVDGENVNNWSAPTQSNQGGIQNVVSQ